jgi:protein-disulfide isomerase-like protein with CxxC motif
VLRLWDYYCGWCWGLVLLLLLLLLLPLLLLLLWQFIIIQGMMYGERFSTFLLLL